MADFCHLAARPGRHPPGPRPRNIGLHSPRDGNHLGAEVPDMCTCLMFATIQHDSALR